MLGDCAACTYDLEISITDPDGLPVDLPPYGDNEPRWLKTGDNAIKTAGDCQTETEVNDASFFFTAADVGDYTITKKLTARPLSYDDMKEVVSQQQSVIDMLSHVADAYPENDTRCENCVTATACPEANAAIEDAIEEIAQSDCDLLRAPLVITWKTANPTGGEPTDDNLEAYFNQPSQPARQQAYCPYKLCRDNKQSDIFEKNLARIPNWSSALVSDYDETQEYDPFFMAPASGNTYKQEFKDHYLDQIVVQGRTQPGTGSVVFTYTGNIKHIVDPTSADMYVGGYHILYYTLMSQQNSMIQMTTRRSSTKHTG
ncbi:MAG: hypothetical protein WDO15_29365 [Bacteroidota bacterium]